MNKAVLADLKGNKDHVQEAVLAVEIVKKQSLYGYRGDDMQQFLRVTVALPRLIAPSKRLLEKGEIFTALGNHAFTSYESNIDFDIR